MISELLFFKNCILIFSCHHISHTSSSLFVGYREIVLNELCDPNVDKETIDVTVL